MKTKLCRPVLVENKFNTIEELQGDIILSNNRLYTCSQLNKLQQHKKQVGDKVFELVLISLDPDEKIQIEDKIHNNFNNTIYTVCPPNSKIIKQNFPALIIEDIIAFPKQYNKVIATQSQISTEYIQQFIEEYNQNNVKDVEIYIEEILGDEGIIKIAFGESDYKPKLTNGFVNIVMKDQYDEEAILAAKIYAGFDPNIDPNDYDERYFQSHKCEIYDAFLKGVKWVNANKNK